MSNQKLFRTSMNGYNKSDVTKYIEKMNFDFQAEVRRMQAELEELSLRLKEADDKISALLPLEEKNKELAAKIEALTAENEELSKLTEAQNEALDKMCSENVSLRAEVETEKTAEAETEASQKAKMYDNMSFQIGDVLIKANKNAEAIIDDANKRAEAIIKAAKDKASEYSERAYDESKRKSSLLNKKLSESTDSYMSEAILSFDSIKNKIDDLNDDMQKVSESLGEKSKKLFDDFNKLIEDTLKNDSDKRS